MALIKDAVQIAMETQYIRGFKLDRHIYKMYRAFRQRQEPPRINSLLIEQVNLPCGVYRCTLELSY